MEASMPIDFGSFSALASSLNSVTQIAQSMIGLRDAAAFQAKLIELQREILSAQSAALSANAHEGALLQRIGELEKEVTALKAWDAEKQRYQLADVGLGSLAYILKPDAQGAEPSHCICANCCNRQKKSVLQPDAELGHHLLRCPECKDRLRVKEKPINI
jgi:hypothetical protein